MDGAKLRISPWVGEFNKTKSPGSSASQRKIPLISTSYNWDSPDAGGHFYDIWGWNFTQLCKAWKSNIISLLKKKSLQWKNPWRPRLGETDSFSTDYLRWSEIIYLMMLKHYNFIHCFSFMYEFLNKVYESSASAFIIRMISDRFTTSKRSENILT